MPRPIVQVDFTDFENRKQQIADQLWEVATNIGFWYIVNHGITEDETKEMFDYSSRFFALPADVKRHHKYNIATNNGWEAGTEVLDEGLPDLKETYNIGYQHMDGILPTEEEVPGFQKVAKHFMDKVEKLSFQVLSCFAIKLGFPEDFFVQHHDPTKEDCTKIMRLLCYPSTEGVTFKPGQWRAGQHTDYGCVTLLFQRGEKGLQVCPGKDTPSGWDTGASAPHELEWTEIEPIPGAIVVNIGDCLMRWSDDRLRSNLHRVRFPLPEENHGARFSIAYFNQPNRSAVIQGPQKKYPVITAGDYLQQRFNKTYTTEAGGEVDVQQN